MPEGLPVFGFKAIKNLGAVPPSTGGSAVPRAFKRNQWRIETPWPRLIDDSLARISVSPDVCNGAACVSSAQIPIWLLVEMRQNGYRDCDLLDVPPRQFTVRHLEAAWAYYETHRNEIDELIARNNRIRSPRIRKMNGPSRGAACITNTRIAVWLLVKSSKDGMSDKEIVERYSHQITLDDLKAAWEYYAEHEEEIDFILKRNECVHDF